MPNTQPDPSSASETRSFDRVSHGFAPDGPAPAPPPVPLEDIVREVVENLSATAKAELALLDARRAFGWEGFKWMSGWGFVAGCALLVAMLALAFGGIMILSPLVGPLLATLIVFVALIAVAAFAGWRAHLGWRDVRTALRNDLMHESEEL